jgi:hypothetical protein
MGEVMNFNKHRIQKQYQQSGSLSINLALDERKQTKITRNISKEMQLGYMLLLSNYNKN